jgi:hypothetical protein
MKNEPAITAKTLLPYAAIFTYLAVYFVASAADLMTTKMAIGSGGSEANVYVTQAGFYFAARAWLLTGLGAVAMGSLFAFGLFYARCVVPHWFDHPLASFGYIYLNPWSRLERSPLHAISYANAFVMLRFLAAANNLCIVVGLKSPIGSAVRAVGHITTPALGFTLVIGALYFALVLTLSPTAAKMLRWYIQIIIK